MRGQTNASNIGGNVGSDTKPIKIVNGVATAVTNDLAVDSNVVHKSGTETIGGAKTFTYTALFIKNNNINVLQRPSNFAFSEIDFVDVNGSPFMQLRATMDQAGSRRFELNIRDISGNDHWTTLAGRTD